MAEPIEDITLSYDTEKEVWEALDELFSTLDSCVLITGSGNDQAPVALVGSYVVRVSDQHYQSRTVTMKPDHSDDEPGWNIHVSVVGDGGETEDWLSAEWAEYLVEAMDGFCDHGETK